MENVPNQRSIRSVRGIEFAKRSETTKDSERSRYRVWKTVRISEAFGPFEVSSLENVPKQRRIRSVRGIEFAKRSESAKHLERLRYRVWKTVRISEGFGTFEVSSLQNGPNHLGIRNVRGIEFAKQSESVRHSERSRNRDWKTVRIT
ncbi:hypothetical protein ACM26V_02685 [Salipaludibacillus sp. HK11]|uniref:hypothetical protein n=1 Tax=Salipaludibacillus sp. HK11 TaxID=3394320 RepID=UPI0039FD1F61